MSHGRKGLVILEERDVTADAVKAGRTNEITENDQMPKSL